jgi:hypothetical protein
MSNQTIDRRPQSISVDIDSKDLAAPFSSAASIERAVILISGWPLVVLLALALSSLAFFSAPNIIGLFHDDGIYAVVGKALNEGHGYRIISLPGDPYQTKYPFLYSYLISWAWSINPLISEIIPLLNFTNAFFYGVSLLLAYMLFVRNSAGGKSDALIYVFLVGANASIFSMTSYTLSDIPFMAACLCCLGLADLENRFLTRTSMIVLLSASVAIAFMLRQAGAALIIAGLTHFLLSGKRKEFYLFVAFVGCLIFPWLFWQARHAPGAVQNPLLAYYQSYESPALFLVLSDPGAASQIVWDNLRYLVYSIDSMILRLHIIPWLRFIIYPLMLCGLLSILRRQTVFFNGFLLFYGGLILSWPFNPARYSMPLIPVLLLSLFHGAQAASAFLQLRRETTWSGMIVPVLVRIPIAMVALLMLGWLWGYVHINRNQHLVQWGGFRSSYGWSGFSETFSWIKKNTQKDDVLAAGYDPMYYLYTGRKAVRPWMHRPETYFYPYGNANPDLGSVEEIRKYLDELGVRFLIVDPMEGYSERVAVAELLDDLVRSYEVQPELVFESTDHFHKIYSLSPRPLSRH